MADDERQDEKSLELPSLRSAFRRRRRKPDGADATQAPAPAPDPAPAPAPAPATEQEPSFEPAPEPERTREPEPVAVASASSNRPVARTEAGPDPVEPTPTAEAHERRRRLPRPTFRLPRRGRLSRRLPVHVPGPLAAAATGAVVGLVVVGLTTASLRLCSSMRGTSSCGNPGLLLLLAITVLAVFLGSLMLRTAGVAAYGSTSFLGVGLLVVLILLALLPVLDRWWVVIVVPLVAVLTHLASWWLTTTYVEPGDRPR
jgi:hypothetical protein